VIAILTNKEDFTADFLILELLSRDAAYVRINTEDFPSKAVLTWSPLDGAHQGVISLATQSVALSDIRSVWYRRPFPPRHRGASPSASGLFVEEEADAALLGILSTLSCLWVSRPEHIRAAELKPFQLKVAAEIGLEIPPTLITNDPEQALRFFELHAGDVIYKVLRRGRVDSPEGTKWIFTSPVGRQDVPSFGRVAATPCLFQRRIEKRSDIRATVIGQEIFAVEIHSQEHPDSKLDWRRVDAHYLRHTPYQLPLDVAAKCIELVRSLHLEFAAIDLIRTEVNRHVFIEINPNGQWAWIQQLCPEIPLRQALANLLITGISR